MSGIKGMKINLNLMVLDALNEPLPVKKEKAPTERVDTSGDLKFFILLTFFAIGFVSICFFLWMFIWQHSVEDVLSNFFK